MQPTLDARQQRNLARLMRFMSRGFKAQRPAFAMKIRVPFRSNPARGPWLIALIGPIVCIPALFMDPPTWVPIAVVAMFVALVPAILLATPSLFWTQRGLVAHGMGEFSTDGVAAEVTFPPSDPAAITVNGIAGRAHPDDVATLRQLMTDTSREAEDGLVLASFR